MRTRTAIAAGALLLAALTGCSSDKSEDEIAADCQKALAKSTAGATEKDRPEACTGLPQEDYEALLISEAMKDTGVIDKDGNVDPEELLGTEQ
jgi:uncharacterized lipoprotein